jgi:hypothetical protein
LSSFPFFGVARFFGRENEKIFKVKKKSEIENAKKVCSNLAYSTFINIYARQCNALVTLTQSTF